MLPSKIRHSNPHVSPDAKPARRLDPVRPRLPISNAAAPETDREPAARAPTDQGLSSVLKSVLGPVQLPNAVRLISALEEASAQVNRADSALPGLSDLVETVIEEEIAKLNRYLDMRGG